jgi:hypothetical protein
MAANKLAALKENGQQIGVNEKVILLNTGKL